MTKRKDNKINIVAVTSILMLFALSACNKGLSRPESWNSSSLLMAKCDSPRAFSVKDLNKHRELYKSSDDKVVSKTSVDEMPDTLTEEVLPVDVTVNCETLKATYTGPIIIRAENSEDDKSGKNIDIINSDKIEGDLIDIGVNSVKIKSTEGTIIVERIFPDKKTDPASYKKALADEKNGSSSLKISIEDSVSAKSIVLKQDVSLKAIESNTL